MQSLGRIPKKRKTEDTGDEQKPEKQPYQPSSGYGSRSSSSSGGGPGAGTVNVRMNGFALTMHKALTVYKYQVVFTGIFRKKSGEEVPRELIDRSKDDVTKQIHRRTLWDIFQNLLTQERHLFGEHKNHFVYDCGLQFYSMEAIFPESDTKSGTIDVSELGPESKTHFSRALVRIEYTIKKTGDFKLDKRESVEKDRSLQQFLEVLTSQGLYKRGEDNLIFRNQRYDDGSRDEILYQERGARDRFDFPFCVKLGSSKSVCLSELKNGSNKLAPILQLEKKTSPFFPELEVHKFVSDCLSDDPGVYGRILKGLMVKTNHLPNDRIFRIHGLSDEPCERITFTQGDKEISVPEYFASKHKMNLDSTTRRNPCVIQMIKRGGVQEYNSYPMSCLVIIKGQRIFDKKQNPKIVDHLIKRARVLPNEMSRSVEEELNRKILVPDTLEYLRAFGVEVNKKLVTAPAKLLEAPRIEYKNDQKALTTMGGQKNAWTINNNTQFFRPGMITDSKKGNNRWLFVAVNLDASMNTNVNDTIHRFMERFISVAKTRGIQMEKPASKELELRGLSGSELWTKMSDVVGKTAHVEGVKYVLFVQRERKDIPRDTFKLLETTYKLTTQQLAYKTIEKATSDRGAQMVIDNVLLKTNEKLGGLNCRVKPPLKVQDWFRRDVMYIGLDISHTGIGSVTPTVVGMAFTKNEQMEVEGQIWYQEPREHLIRNMKDRIVEALLEFKKNSKIFPDNIFVYRGGVSEGEYDKVLEVEVTQFQEAFKDKRLAFPGGRKPSLKYISVQRNSGYRLMPERSHAFNVKSEAVRENVLPGTCADTGIVNESRKEFVLVPHQAIQGTAKPSKYVVLHNDPDRKGPQGIPLHELELVTHSWCFMHGIVTSPVSCPSILYQAGDLAKRGHNNYKSYEVRKPVMMPPQEETEAREAFFEELSEKLKVILDHRFWA